MINKAELSHEQLIKDSNERYDQRGKQYPYTAKVVFWDDRHTQYLRFHGIAKHLSMDVVVYLT